MRNALALVVLSSLSACGAAERQHTLGLLGKTDIWYWFVDTDVKDGRVVYQAMCGQNFNCPYEPGRSYPARLHAGKGDVGGKPSLVVDEIHGGDIKRADVVQLACDDPGKHVEWTPEKYNPDPKAFAYPFTCVPGPPTWRFDRDEATAQKPGQAPSPACEAQPAFANTTLQVLITVTPYGTKQWLQEDAPVQIASMLLANLNRNTSGIRFVEANGVMPQIIFAVSVNEERAGTPQYTSTVHVNGLAKTEELFVETSSYPQQTTLEDTIDSLATRTLEWFEKGWQSKGCR